MRWKETNRRRLSHVQCVVIKRRSAKSACVHDVLVRKVFTAQRPINVNNLKSSVDNGANSFRRFGNNRGSLLQGQTTFKGKVGGIVLAMVYVSRVFLFRFQTLLSITLFACSGKFVLKHPVHEDDGPFKTLYTGWHRSAGL